MLGSFGPMELVLILAIVVVIFGASKLPQLGKGLGEGIRSLKKSLSDDSEAESEPERKQLSEKRSP